MKTTIMKMTSNSLKALFLFGLAINLASCSKDDDSPAPAPAVEQNPLSGYLTASGFDQVTTPTVNSTPYEFGYSFKPSVNGKITALVAKLPDANAALRVTIRNKATSAILRTETMNVAAAGVETTLTITALDLVAGTEYWITLNSDDWYTHRKTDNSNVTYPFTVGDIVITGYGYKSGTAQDAPNAFPMNYYAGDLSFKFLKN